MRSMCVGEVDGGGWEEVAASIHLGWPRSSIGILRPGQQPAQAVRNGASDLAVVRLSPRREDSFSLLRELREAFSGVIVCVSTNDSETNIIEALDAGADDYFMLPLNRALFVARVRAALRRAGEHGLAAAHILQYGDLHIDPERHEARMDGRSLRLTPTEFKLVVDLAGRGDLVTRKETLCESLWGLYDSSEGATLRKHIQAIRRKLEAAGRGAVSIETIPGVGYRLADHNLHLRTG